MAFLRRFWESMGQGEEEKREINSLTIRDHGESLWAQLANPKPYPMNSALNGARFTIKKQSLGNPSAKSWESKGVICRWSKLLHLIASVVTRSLLGRYMANDAWKSSHHDLERASLCLDSDCTNNNEADHGTAASLSSRIKRIVPLAQPLLQTSNTLQLGDNLLNMPAVAGNASMTWLLVNIREATTNFSVSRSFLSSLGTQIRRAKAGVSGPKRACSEGRGQ